MSDNRRMVMVLGATNRIDAIDSAVLRRLPLQFEIGIPCDEQRELIFNLILKNQNFDKDVNIKRLSKMTEGFSASDIKELCRYAALIRLNDFIKLQCLDEDLSVREK